MIFLKKILEMVPSSFFLFLETYEKLKLKCATPSKNTVKCNYSQWGVHVHISKLRSI